MHLLLQLHGNLLLHLRHFRRNGALHLFRNLLVDLFGKLLLTLCKQFLRLLLQGVNAFFCFLVVGPRVSVELLCPLKGRHHKGIGILRKFLLRQIDTGLHRAASDAAGAVIVCQKDRACHHPADPVGQVPWQILPFFVSGKGDGIPDLVFPVRKDSLLHHTFCLFALRIRKPPLLQPQTVDLIRQRIEGYRLALPLQITAVSPFCIQNLFRLQKLLWRILFPADGGKQLYIHQVFVLKVKRRRMLHVRCGDSKPRQKTHSDHHQQEEGEKPLPAVQNLSMKFHFLYVGRFLFFYH